MDRAVYIFFINLIFICFPVGVKIWGWDYLFVTGPGNYLSSPDYVSNNVEQQPPSHSIRRHFAPKRIDINHIEGKGVGYNHGYTGMDIITGPEYQSGHFLPLIGINGLVFDNGKIGANIGFIGRYLPQSSCTVFGFNLFYDFREGKRGNYHQVGGGVELLNKRWEMHANVNIPIGVKRHVKKCVFDDYIGDFRAVLRKYEYAPNAADASVGFYLVNGKHFQLYVSGGGYYFSGKCGQHAVGGKAILRPQFNDYLYLEMSVSHDRTFQTIYQVNLVFSIPLYNYSSVLKKKSGPCGMSNRQIYQPINREIILLENCSWKANFD